MPNIVNQMTVKVLERDLEESEGMVLVSFGGLDVETTEKVRGEVAEKGARMRMVRNKLARRVLKDKGFEFSDDTFQGNVAMAFGDTEAVIGAAKAFSSDDVKKTKLVQFKGGLLQGETLDAASAAQLADLPDKDTMRAMMLGLLSAPARQLVCVVNAVPSAAVRVVQAQADAGGFKDE